jgi:hypothetical protein
VKLDEEKSKYAGLAQENSFGKALQFASGGCKSRNSPVHVQKRV